MQRKESTAISRDIEMQVSIVVATCYEWNGLDIYPIARLCRVASGHRVHLEVDSSCRVQQRQLGRIDAILVRLLLRGLNLHQAHYQH